MSKAQVVVDVDVHLESPAFSFDGRVASGTLVLKDQDVPRCTVAPAGGDSITRFVFTCPGIGVEPEVVYLVVANEAGVRTFTPAAPVPEGGYRVETQVGAGTYTFQFEFEVGGQPVFVNPVPGTVLVVTEAQPPVDWDTPETMGPLRRAGAALVRPDGREVRLFGRHTWDNTFDVINDQRWRAFDFQGYLAAMKATGENVTRLWRWEQSIWTSLLVPPDKVATVLFHASHDFDGDEWVQPWLRPQTGPRAADGLWRLDFAQHDPKFYQRIRERVLACQEAGIYPIVMLHEGCLIRDPQGEYWQKHAMAPGNNVQGLGTTRDDIYQDGPLRAVWDAYIQRMVLNLADCPMVLWEVANEARVESRVWQEWVMGRVRELEAGGPYRHPIGMTAMDGGTDEMLVTSTADFICPGSANYKAPIFANGTGKPCFLDSDHLWGMGTPANGCTVQWVEQAAAHGYNVLLMDPWVGNIWPVEPTLDPVRAELGRQARLLNG